MTRMSIEQGPSDLGVDLTQDIAPALVDLLDPDDDALAADDDEADVDLDL